MKSPAAGLLHGLTSWDLRIDKKSIGDENVIAWIDAVTKLPNSWHALSFNSEWVSDSEGKTMNLDLFNARVDDDNLKFYFVPVGLHLRTLVVDLWKDLVERPSVQITSALRSFILSCRRLGERTPSTA